MTQLPTVTVDADKGHEGVIHVTVPPDAAPGTYHLNIEGKVVMPPLVVRGEERDDHLPEGKR